MMQLRTWARRLTLPIMAATLLTTAVASQSAIAQEATPTMSQSTATITVPGEGSAAVTPDAASATVGVNVSNADLATAQAEADTQITAIIEALKSAGVEESDIQTSSYSVSVMQNYDNSGNPLEVTGYQVSNMVTFVVRPVDKLGDVLDAAVTAGANSVWGVTFLVEDSLEASNQARAAAVTDAKARADVLAEAAGMQVGNIISITETIGPSTLPITKQADSAMGMGGGTPIQTGQNTITVNVQIVYELIHA